MLNMKKLISSIFLILVSINARGQSADSTMRLSIKEAIDYAMNNQKDVQNAAIDADISRYKVKETIGIGLPQLNGSFDVKDYEQIPTSLIPAQFFGGKEGEYAAVQFGTRWNATGGLSASQLIFDPSYLIGVAASKTYRELTEKNLNRTKIETAVTVTKAYYTLLLVRERKKIIDANVLRLLKLYNDTKAMFENGFIEKIDLDRVHVALNNVTSEQEKIERFIELSERTLKFQMGLSDKIHVVITDSLDANAIKHLNIPIESSEPTRRIEYSILQTQQQLQEYNLKRYKAQYLPSLVAYGVLNASAQRTSFTVFDPSYRWYSTGIIGATLSINFFDGFQKNYRIKQETLALQKIKNEVTNFENGVNLEVAASRAGLLDALSTLNTQDENLSLATSVVSTTKLKYDQGVGSNLEVLDAETSLKEAQANYFNALYDAIIAKINLDKSLGNFNY